MAKSDLASKNIFGFKRYFFNIQKKMKINMTNKDGMVTYFYCN